MKKTPLTPKQAQVRVDSLLKGIDNTNLNIAKSQTKVVAAVKEIKDLLPAVTSAVAEKPGKKSKVIFSLKSAQPTTSKAAPKGTDTRPPLKEVITTILTSRGAMNAAEIFRTATADYGTWSRQSVYNCLEKHFDRDGNKYAVRPSVGHRVSKSGDDEADQFIESVQAVESVSGVA